MSLLTHPAFLVGLGGAAGSIARYYMARAIRSYVGEAEFPWPVFVINVIGSFVIGWLAVVAKDRGGTVYLLLAVGLCGGFTTFSAFSLDVVELFQRDRPGTALLYALSSLVCGSLGFLAAWWLAGKC